jgi:hypothetical protein
MKASYIVAWGDDDTETRLEQLGELKRAFPGWEIWSTGSAWCARPRPHIIAGSAGDLAERIKIAHTSPPDGSPSLASWRSYRTRARQFRDFEERAGKAWRRMRAQPTRRPRHADQSPQAEPPGVA